MPFQNWNALYENKAAAEPILAAAGIGFTGWINGRPCVNGLPLSGNEETIVPLLEKALAAKAPQKTKNQKGTSHGK